MRQWPFAWVAWLVYATSWFIPVIKDGAALPGALPGWQAFRVAFAPLWPYEGISYDTWYTTMLAALSALTNVVMVLSPLLFLRSRSAFMVIWGWASAAAIGIDAFWFLMGHGSTDALPLRAGYYLWWLSFLPLMTACFIGARRSRP